MITFLFILLVACVAVYFKMETAELTDRFNNLSFHFDRLDNRLEKKLVEVMAEIKDLDRFNENLADSVDTINQKVVKLSKPSCKSTKKK